MSFECGQQRVMRLGWERPGSLALRRVLTNHMREYFTYGSVGAPGATPAPTRQLRFNHCAARLRLGDFPCAMEGYNPKFCMAD